MYPWLILGKLLKFYVKLNLPLLTCIYVSLFVVVQTKDGPVTFNSFVTVLRLELIHFLLLQSSVNSWGSSFNIKSHY